MTPPALAQHRTMAPLNPRSTRLTALRATRRGRAACQRTHSSPAGQSSAGDDSEDGGDEPSRIKQLSDEAAKYRTRAKAADERADQADSTIRDLRIENAFIRHALPLVDDVTAAWKLADHALAKVDDDDNVTGMKELVQSVIRNYPYLEGQPDTMPMALPGSGGSPINGRRQTDDVTSRAVLEKKYPGPPKAGLTPNGGAVAISRCRPGLRHTSPALR